MLKSFGKQPVLMSWVNPELRAQVAQSVLHNHGFFNGHVGFETITQKYGGGFTWRRSLQNFWDIFRFKEPKPAGPASSNSLTSPASLTTSPDSLKTSPDEKK